jgi:uncharacterized protein (TIGR02996 family)
MIPSDNDRCPCRSGVAYRRCCKKQRRFRQRALREFIGAECRRNPEECIPVVELLGRFRRHLARRGYELAVEAWLRSDLGDLGFRLDGASVGGLSWRARPRRAVTEVIERPQAEGLRQAQEALQAGDDEATLGGLLSVWRQSRSPALAGLIDMVGTRLRKSPPDDETSWHALAKSGDPAVLGRLLAAPWPRRLRDALRRVEALRRFLPDPRLARAYVTLLERFPGDYTGETAVSFWLAVIGDARSVHDPRFEGRLSAAARSVHLGEWRCRGVDPEARRGVTSIPRSLTPSDEVRIERLEAAVRADSAALTEANLLAAIHADPEDDGPRLVYADWLLERGDPRGELIVLQCTPRGERGQGAELRERGLLQLYALDWLGPLGAVVRPDEATFKRGFLAGCVCRASDTALLGLTGERTWATVRMIRLAPVHASRPPSTRKLAELLGHPAMRSLTALHGASPELVAALCDGGRASRLRELFQTNRWSVRLPTREDFPALEHLGLGHRVPLAQLAGAEMWTWLPRLTVHADTVHALTGLGAWQRMLSRQPHRLSELRFYTSAPDGKPRGVHASLTGLSGDLSRLHVRWFGRTRSVMVSRLVDALQAMDRDALTELVVDNCDRFVFSRYHRTRLERAAARFVGPLERLRLPWQ